MGTKWTDVEQEVLSHMSLYMGPSDGAPNAGDEFWEFVRNRMQYLFGGKRTYTVHSVQAYTTRLQTRGHFIPPIGTMRPYQHTQEVIDFFAQSLHTGNIPQLIAEAATRFEPGYYPSDVQTVEYLRGWIANSSIGWSLETKHYCCQLYSIQDPRHGGQRLNDTLIHQKLASRDPSEVFMCNEYSVQHFFISLLIQPAIADRLHENGLAALTCFEGKSNVPPNQTACATIFGAGIHEENRRDIQLRVDNIVLALDQGTTP